MIVPKFAEPDELNKAYLLQVCCRRFLVVRYCTERCKYKLGLFINEIFIYFYFYSRAFNANNK